MMKICKLSPSQRVQGRWLCTLDDGSILRVGENEVLRFALYAGMELDEGTYEALTASARRGAVREKALDLISARPMSKKELLDKLTARPRDPKKAPADPEDAQAAVDWLEELGYLNDGEYARTVVKHYAAKGYGERKLRDELWRRGVPREYWDGALEEQGAAGGDSLDRLVEKKLRGAEPTRENLKKVSDYLARRGFGWEEIREALDRCGADIEEE